LTTPIDVDALSDHACVIVLSRVARDWLSERPGEAADALLSAAVATGVEFSELPGWALDARRSDDEAARSARSALRLIVAGTDDQAIGWVRTAVRETAEARAQILDPVSLGILGGILIGSILAARVKKAGPIEFYEGIPEELPEVLRAGLKARTPDADV
jgi:hypothetical protein